MGVGTLTIRGCYFKSEYGRTVSSHGGTPGVRLSITDSGGASMDVFIDYRQVATIAKSINGLGTGGDEIKLQVQTP